MLVLKETFTFHVFLRITMYAEPRLKNNNEKVADIVSVVGFTR